jgi:hypothetical protein
MLGMRKCMGERLYAKGALPEAPLVNGSPTGATQARPDATSCEQNEGAPKGPFIRRVGFAFVHLAD